MATEREIIREFLVALGFQIDTPGLRNFNSALGGLTKTAGKAGAVIAGVAVAAEVMVAKFSRNMEKLYYASERTGAAVKNIQALEFGAEQIGLKGEDARAALEGLARSLRLNPGLVGLLNSLGVATEGRDKADIMRDLVTQLSKMPHYVGAQFAEMFGMDEKTFFHMKRWSAELAAAERERLQLQAESGISAQEAAAASREYMNVLRGVWERVEILAQAIGIRLLPYFREFAGTVRDVLSDLIRWQREGFQFDWGEWGAQIKDIVDDLRQFKDMIVWLINTDIAQGIFGGLIEQGKKFAHIVLDLIGAQTALLSGNVSKARDKLASAANRFVNDDASPDVAPANQSWLGRALNFIRGRDRAGSPEWPFGLGGSGAAKSGAAGDASDWPTTPEMIDAAARRGKRAPLGVQQNNPGNLRRWGGAAVKNGFAMFGTPQEGLGAMAAQLSLYAKRGLKTITDIITTWAPPSENDTPGYIAAVAKRMGVDAKTALNMNDPKIVANLMDAMIKQEQGYNPYGAADILGAASSRVGGGAVIHQRNNITVSGASNANDVAERIGKELDRTNADLVRNMNGALQ